MEAFQALDEAAQNQQALSESKSSPTVIASDIENFLDQRISIESDCSRIMK